mmetsp:Transcript_15450/g.36726  ORF Transcript_15450/g.36726 Transcript_15450/m.36726 type:complete len:246 (-) Transcript_15450:30-767(-)
MRHEVLACLDGPQQRSAGRLHQRRGPGRSGHAERGQRGPLVAHPAWRQRPVAGAQPRTARVLHQFLCGRALCKARVAQQELHQGAMSCLCGDVDWQAAINLPLCLGTPLRGAEKPRSQLLQAHLRADVQERGLVGEPRAEQPSSRICKEDRDVVHARKCSYRQRRQAIRLQDIDVGSEVNQSPNTGLLAKPGGPMQRGARAAEHLQACAMVMEDRDNLRVTPGSCVVHGSDARRVHGSSSSTIFK